MIAAAFRLCGGECARDNVEDDDRLEPPLPLETADGPAVEFEHGGLVADEKRDRSRPGQVEGLW